MQWVRTSQGRDAMMTQYRMSSTSDQNVCPCFTKHILSFCWSDVCPAARTSTAQFSSPQGSVLHPFPIYFGQSNAFSPRSRLCATPRARDRWACHRWAPLRLTVAKHGDCAAVGGRGGDAEGAARTMWGSSEQQDLLGERGRICFPMRE